ncbi:MAG TPA: hypothetical protein PK530_24375 [Anaerolineales bacterium]|nr:hypothetical protein [Anaerolineales bacterium]
MLLRNYGLFWKVQNVFWGRQKNPGALFGKPALEKKFGPVNFREQAGIYALYADYDLLYIGQTGGKGQKLLARLNQHRKDDLADRWNMFSWFGTRAVSDDGELGDETGNTDLSHQSVLNHLEAILIHVAEPSLNRQGGKWGTGVEQYLQHRDKDLLGPSVEEMIIDIWKARL